MTELRIGAFLAGLAVLAGCGTSIIYTLVIPRGFSSRLAVFVGRRIVRRTFLLFANRFESFEAKDRVLALAAPMALLTLFLVWVLGFLAGYTLVVWPLSGVSLPEAARQTAASLFTLSLGPSHRVAPTALHLMAAGTGLLVVALEIGYLPTIYAAFNRRETLVTLLESRAGAPAWGPEILARHQLVGIVDSLPELYDAWERWAAEVDETHSTYVILVSFRSPHHLRSWVLALLAVLDSAALYLSLAPKAAPSEARLCLRMGFTCFRDVASTFGIPFEHDPRPDTPIQLTYEEFLEGIRRVEESGFPMEESPADAWPHFRGWRVNYESIAYALADQTIAAPGPWSGSRRHVKGTIAPVRPVDRRPRDPEDERSSTFDAPQ